MKEYNRRKHLQRDFLGIEGFYQVGQAADHDKSRYCFAIVGWFDYLVMKAAHMVLSHWDPRSFHIYLLPERLNKDRNRQYDLYY